MLPFSTFVAYDSNRMQMARRLFALSLAAGYASFSRGQEQEPDHPTFPPHPDRNKPDDRLPNGKSRNDAIAEEEHKKALEEADQLIGMAQKLKQEIGEAGKFVVPLSAVRRTEDIEKLAKKIRGRLRV